MQSAELGEVVEASQREARVPHEGDPVSELPRGHSLIPRIDRPWSQRTT